jgi:mono/diheme cytochrome c family protein
VRRTLLVIAVLTALLSACGGPARQQDGGGVDRGPASGDADRGAVAFANNCAVCHGEAAQGTTQGPPLVHEVYEPSHHADVTFLLAVQRGVQQHHWDFGPMPPVPGVSEQDVADIVVYVRELQRAAGIE